MPWWSRGCENRPEAGLLQGNATDLGISTQDRPGLNAHGHDFLVGGYEFVAHLDGLLQGDAGFLQ
jgi:hypothetical protein